MIERKCVHLIQITLYLGIRHSVYMYQVIVRIVQILWMLGKIDLQWHYNYRTDLKLILLKIWKGFYVELYFKGSTIYFISYLKFLHIKLYVLTSNYSHGFIVCDVFFFYLILLGIFSPTEVFYSQLKIKTKSNFQRKFVNYIYFILTYKMTESDLKVSPPQ